MSKDLTQAGVEPSISEMLNDPIVQLVLKRDGLNRADVERAAEAAADQLKRAA